MTLDQAVLEHWMAGDQVPGVGFGLYEPVVITAGPWTGTLGAAVALVSLTPGRSTRWRLGVDGAMSTYRKPTWRRPELWRDSVVLGEPLCS